MIRWISVEIEVPVVDDLAQVRAGHEAHRQVEHAVVLAAAVDRDDVRVLQRGREPGLGLEAGHRVGVLGVLGRDDLQRHGAVQLDVRRPCRPRPCRRDRGCPRSGSRRTSSPGSSLVRRSVASSTMSHIPRRRFGPSRAIRTRFESCRHATSALTAAARFARQPLSSVRCDAPGVALDSADRKLYAAQVALVAAAYYGSAKLGLKLAFESGSVTAVWPPTGIALAAVVLWGYRIWPGVALGACLANGWTGHPALRRARHHRRQHARGARGRLPAAAGRGLPALARARPRRGRAGRPGRRRQHDDQRDDRRDDPAGGRRDLRRPVRFGLAHLVAGGPRRRPDRRAGAARRRHPLALPARARAAPGGRSASAAPWSASACSSSRPRRR